LQCILTADFVVDVDAVVSTRDKSGTELGSTDALATATTDLTLGTRSVTCRAQTRHSTAAVLYSLLSNRIER